MDIDFVFTGCILFFKLNARNIQGFQLKLKLHSRSSCLAERQWLVQPKNTSEALHSCIGLAGLMNTTLCREWIFCYPTLPWNDQFEHIIFYRALGSLHGTILC